jgi:NADP-dependent 3-hydroxy acid dehydrogenase YdfG
MKDKVVLIVGGSGGVGTASASLFAKAGAKIVLAARNREKAEETAKQINNNGGEAYVIGVDVTDMSSVYKMVDDIIKELGKIDILVNAFGLGIIQPLLDVHPEKAKEVFDVNVFGTFMVTQAVLRHMATAKSGTVVMIPGILGKSVMKGSSVYSASKFAVTGFTKALVDEHRRSNIKFTLMYLGGIDTPFWDSELIDMRVQRDKMLTADEVAKAIYYAVNQPGSSVLNEIVIQPDSHQMV